MRLHRKGLGLAALGVTALLAMSGCTSDSDSESSGSGGGDIVIGSIGAYSGQLASSYHGGQVALEAWAESVNDSGGINGRQIKLIVKDVGDSPSQGLTAAKELVEREKAVAIVYDSDGSDTNWAPYIETTGVPVVGGVPLATPFLSSPNFFPSGTNVIAMFYGMEQLAKTFGPNLGVLYCAESPSCALFPKLLGGLAPSTGVKIAVEAKVSATATDYTAVCQQLKDANVESYYVGADSATVLRVASACAAQGVTAKIVTTDGTVTNAWVQNPAVDGMLSSELNFPFFDDSVPATKEFQDAMKKYAPNIGAEMGPTAAYAWSAGKLFEKALENAGDDEVTPDSVKRGLYAMKDETLGGLTPPLTYTEGKPTLVNCNFVLGIEDGKFTAPQGLKTSCAPDDVISELASQLG